MNKAVSTLTAATAGVGLAVASTSAKAFIIAPAIAAAALAGGVFGGAALGSAATGYPYGYYSNGYWYPTAYSAPTVVETAPAVTVNSTTCFIRHRWIDGVRQPVRVCTSP
jgi:hypothetical protein